MTNSRQAKTRGWALAIAALGMVLWIASIALPRIFGDTRGWTDDDSVAYHAAGKRLHDLLEGGHDHDVTPHFDSKEAEEAFTEMQRKKRRTHIQVDPRDLEQAKAVFQAEQDKLEAARVGNTRQIGVLFWGGVVLMFGGGVAFFAANQADD
jgi:hypothetical protein